VIAVLGACVASEVTSAKMKSYLGLLSAFLSALHVFMQVLWKELGLLQTIEDNADSKGIANVILRAKEKEMVEPDVVARTKPDGVASHERDHLLARAPVTASKNTSMALLNLEDVRFKLTLDKAGKGDKVAQYDVANFYFRGFGVEKDEKAALDWFKKSAAKSHTVKGHAGAQYEVARFYKLGLGGVTVDDDTANRYFGLAMNQGQPPPEDHPMIDQRRALPLEGYPLIDRCKSLLPMIAKLRSDLA
jgi:hypothetical protein